MTLENLGYNASLKRYRKDQNLDALKVGRIISEHKERYIIKNDEGEFEGELLGKLRFNVQKA